MCIAGNRPPSKRDPRKRFPHVLQSGAGRGIISVVPAKPRVPICAVVAQLDRSFGSDPKGRRFESCLPHHADALLESRAFFFCPVFGKAAPGAPSGMRTARPAGQRPGRFQQSCGLLESARVPAEPGWRNGSSAPSPSGRDHASRERSHSPRGEVAKYAPQERFLHAPAGAPKKALRKRKAFPFLWLVWLYTA